MDIFPLEAADRAAASAFVLPYERFCIPLVSRLLGSTVPAYAAVDEDGVWRAVFTFSKAGQIFHCIPLKNAAPRDALYEACCRFFSAQREHDFFSINGESHGTQLLLQALTQATGQASTRVQQYDFMRSPEVAQVAVRAEWAQPLPDDCKIVRCTPSMADMLFPLQTAYEKEEVVFNLDTYSENVSFLALKKALLEQSVYALSVQGTIVAKGGTNAQGVHYVQLGGVYTATTARKKGYATALIRHIVRDMASQQKRAALFVKTGNVAAQRLYERCGFTKYGVYETAYL